MASNQAGTTTGGGGFVLRPSALRVEPAVDSSSSSGLAATSSAAVASNDTKTFTFAPLTERVQLTSAPISVSNGTSASNGKVEAVAATSGGDEDANHGSSEAISSSQTSANNEPDSANFVFGQNLAERAILPVIEPSSSSDDATSTSRVGEEAATGVASTSTINGDSSNEQSSSALDKASEDRLNPSAGDNEAAAAEPQATLSDSSTSAKKRTFEAITGEEDESTVLAIQCKLYAWDSVTANWIERGKGTLKLNDKMKDDKLCSRLVMRTQGILKVILNCSLVSGMKFDLTSEGHLRFTNIDGIIIIKAKEKAIEQLHQAIEYRLRELSKRFKSDESTSATGGIGSANNEDDNSSASST